MKNKNKNKKNNIIVVAMDFSEQSQYALEHAIGIAKTLKYEIHLLHVLFKKIKLTPEEIEEKLKQYAEKIRSEHNLVVNYSIHEGNVVTKIGEVIDELKANYLALGTRGKTGVEFIFGNYTAKIIQNSMVPSLVVQKRHFDEDSYKNIIIPIDETPETRQKVKYALLFAHKWKARVCLLGKAWSDRYYENKIKSNIAQIKKILQQNNIPVEITISEDKRTNFIQQVVEFAIHKNGDLIIIMNDFESIVPGMFTGGIFSGGESIEEFIDNAAKIPLLVVNATQIGKSRGWFSSITVSGG